LEESSSYNLKSENASISPDDLNRLIKYGKPEEIDEFLSEVMQKKMKLPCKVTGKTIFITLPPQRIHSGSVTDLLKLLLT